MARVSARTDLPAKDARPPAAYLLAGKHEAERRRAYDELYAELSAAGAGPELDVFLRLIADGRAAINVTVAKCVQFLRSGRWLNIYESLELETGATGAALESLLRRRLGKYYAMRRRIDKMLRFRRDMHYASLNIGGSGATKYGLCCVLLRATAEPPFGTIFSGDTLLNVFDGSGKVVRDTLDVLRRFGTRSELPRLAALRYSRMLSRRGDEVPPGIDVPRTVALLENSDSLMEMHLHGAVSATAVEAIAMRRADRDHLWELTRESQRMRPPRPQEFDVVPQFAEMMRLLEQRRIPLKVVE